jgi:hypothetical protein
MPGLVPGTQVLKRREAPKTWMAGTSARRRASRFCPAMTTSMRQVSILAGFWNGHATRGLPFSKSHVSVRYLQGINALEQAALRLTRSVHLGVLGSRLSCTAVRKRQRASRLLNQRASRTTPYCSGKVQVKVWTNRQLHCAGRSYSEAPKIRSSEPYVRKGAANR